MFANKAQERFILNSKKKQEEKKKAEKKVATPKAVVPLKGNVGVLASQKVSSQKPTTPKETASKPVASKVTAEKQIQQQKLNYNLAQSRGDYLGKRLANTAANTVRTSAGIPLYSSAVGDRQAALTTAKGLIGLKQNISNQMANTANIPQIPKSNKVVGKIAQNLLTTIPALRDTGKAVTGLMYGNLPSDAEYTRNRIAQTAYGKGMYGVAQGISPVNTNPYIQNALRGPDITNSLAFKAGEVGGTLASFAVPYAGTEKAIGQGLLKAVPRLANAPKLGQKVAKSVATDLTVGLPLNVNYAYNKNELRGREALKNIAQNTALDIGAGGVLEGLGFVIGKTLKSGKKINSVDDLRSLTPQEVSEVDNIVKSTPNQAVQPQTFVNEPTASKPLEAATNLQQTAPRITDNRKFKDLGADVNQFPQEMKTSRFKTNTMRNSKVFSEAEKGIDDAVYEYEVVSEKKSLQEAKQRLQADFDGEVKDLSQKKDFDGVDLDTSMGIAEQYLKEAEETGDFKKFLEWTKRIQEKGTQSGQMIQAFAKYTRTPEGALVKANQTINKIVKELAKDNPKLLDTINEETREVLRKALNGEFGKIKGSKKFVEDIRNLALDGNINKESVEELIKGKYDIPTLANADVKAITENMRLGQDATDPYMREMYFNRAEQIISDKVPAAKREKFRALQRLSLILNPKTLITRNPLGNVILGTAENIKDIPASVVDRLVSAKTGQRTTTGLTPQKLIEQAEGMKQGFSEWRKDIKYGVDTSPSRGQYELPNKRIFKNDILNNLDMFERRALQLGDRPFYQAAYNSRIGELKKLGITGEEAEKQSRLYALDRVFQNDSALSKGASKIRNSLNEMAGGFPVGDLIMPFTQTPANIMDKLLDYSPVSLVKAVKEWGNIGKGTFDQKRFVDLVGRNLTGVGIAMLGYTLAKNDIITGDLYGNNKDLYNAQQMAGQKSYAFKIDGKYYTFDWAAPIGNIFAAAADAQKAMADKDDFLDALGAGVVSAVDTVFSQSFLSGVFDMLSGYSPASGIAKSLLGSTTQLTPTVGANIAKTIDPYIRETYAPSKLTQTKNKLVARIPFASKMLPQKLGTDGKPIMQNQGRGIGSKIVENFIAPYNLGVENADKVNNEAIRLQGITGNNSVLLNSADKYVQYDGKKTELTTEQYQEYQKLIGQNAYNQINALMSTEDYKNMNDEKKAEAFQKINDAVRKEAKKEILVSAGYDPEEIWLDGVGKKALAGYEATNGSISPEDYYKQYYQAQKGYSSSVGKAMAIMENGNTETDKTVLSGMDISRKTTVKAQRLLDAGITAEEYTKIRKEANTDGESLTTRELLEYIRKNGYSDIQRRAILSANRS